MDSSWTDDIPVCINTGVGSATNEIYRKDGRRVEMHPTEDRLFHFSVEEFGVSLYGVVDGFGGAGVADFSAKKMPAELLLGQVSKNSSDEVIRDVLRQTFASVDREYFESISESLASRVVLRFDTPNSDDPTLAMLDAATITGSSATVGLLIDNSRLFVGNVGDTQAVVARQLPDGQLKAIQLTVDHVIDNEDEMLRLSHLGVEASKLMGALAPQGYTRCLGCHRVKGGFKEVDSLKNASDEPVLSVPEIHGPLKIDSSHLFLLIFSRPLARCLEEILSSSSSENPPSVATELCSIVRDHFVENFSVSGVAQSVVDKIVRMHRENFEQTEGAFANLSTTCREDVSLLVRNFHSKLSSTKSRPSRSSGSNATMTVTNQETIGAGNNRFLRTTRSSTTTESSEAFLKPDREFSVDEEGRIKPYVDFSHFHREWNKFKTSQQQQS